VAAAGLCWATTGIFGTILFEKSLDPLDVASTRTVLAALVFLLYLLIRDPRLLKAGGYQLLMLAGGGLVAVTFFNIFYMNAIESTGVSTAVVLLYTSPVFAVFLSRMFLKEPLTGGKVIALVLAFGGVILVVEAYEFFSLHFDAFGVAMGLGAGLCFAILSVFGKYILGGTNQLTASFYLLFFGAFFLVFVRPPWLALGQLVGVSTRGPAGGGAPPEVVLPVEASGITLNAELFTTVLHLAAIVIISTFLAHVLYISGLSYLEAGKASIAVAIEPVAAILMAFAFLGERLTALQYLGVVLVMAAVILIRREGSRQEGG